MNDLTQDNIRTASPTSTNSLSNEESEQLFPKSLVTEEVQLALNKVQDLLHFSPKSSTFDRFLGSH